MMGPSSFPEATASEADAAALAAYAELIAARLTEPHSEIRLLPEAEAVITDLRRWLHELERADAFGENFSSFLGKLAGLAGSLALVLHLAADLDNSGRPIGKGTADAVAKIVREFVVPHGLAFYRATADRGVAEDQRALASYVLTETKARFTASDFTNNVRCVRGLGRWDVFRAVDFMVAYGWLAPEGDHAPPTAWTLTHGLREAMAERREAEAARKVMVRDIIRDAGAKGLSGKDLS